MAEAREIYPSPTVQFVVFEMRYPTALFLERPEGKEAVYERLSEAFPLLHAINTVQFTFGSPPGILGGAIPGISPSASGIKMMNRDRTRSATLGRLRCRWRPRCTKATKTLLRQSARFCRR